MYSRAIYSPPNERRAGVGLHVFQKNGRHARETKDADWAPVNMRGSPVCLFKFGSTRGNKRAHRARWTRETCVHVVQYTYALIS